MTERRRNEAIPAPNEVAWAERVAVLPETSVDARAVIFWLLGFVAPLSKTPGRRRNEASRGPIVYPGGQTEGASLDLDEYEERLSTFDFLTIEEQRGLVSALRLEMDRSSYFAQTKSAPRSLEAQPNYERMAAGGWDGEAVPAMRGPEASRMPTVEQTIEACASLLLNMADNETLTEEVRRLAPYFSHYMRMIMLPARGSAAASRTPDGDSE